MFIFCCLFSSIDKEGLSEIAYMSYMKDFDLQEKQLLKYREPRFPKIKKSLLEKNIRLSDKKFLREL